MDPLKKIQLTFSNNAQLQFGTVGNLTRAQTATHVSEDSPIDSVPEFEEDDGDWPDMDDYNVIADVAGDGFLLEEYSL